MALIHLKNTSAGKASPYADWGTAATTWAEVLTVAVAGDTIYVDSGYTTANLGTLTFPGTPASPNIVLSGTPSGTGTETGLSALVAGALFTYAGGANQTINGSAYFHGFSFTNTRGTGGNNVFATTSGNVQVHEDCYYRATGSTATNSPCAMGSATAGASTFVQLINPTFAFGSGTSNRIVCNGRVEIMGGDYDNVGAETTASFFELPTAGAQLRVTGFDFTNCATTMSLVSAFGNAAATAIFSDCKLPASWTGAYCLTLAAGTRAEFYNCDNADTNYRFYIDDYAGAVREDTGIYLSSTDGQNLSDKFTCSANVKYPMALRGRWLYAYDSGAGSAKTATVQCARDGSATRYNDDEVWLEVECLGDANYPLGVWSSDRRAPLAAAVAQAAGTGSWTGLSGTNATFAVSASYTPRGAGYVRARVCAAIPSSGVVYANPVLTLT